MPELDDQFNEVGTITISENNGDRVYLVKPLYPTSESDLERYYLFQNFEVFDIPEDSIPEDFKDHVYDGYYFWNEERGFYRNKNWKEPKPIFDPTRATFETAAQLAYIAAMNDIEL